MKNTINVVLAVLFLIGANSYSFASPDTEGRAMEAQEISQSDNGESFGSAPNSGDGISDGSGMDTQNGPKSDSGVSDGPAPNSGDGVPDGSGK